MIRAVANVGSTIRKGDVFMVIGSFVDEGGYEYRRIRRMSDRRTIVVSMGDLHDDDLFENFEISREELDEAANRALRRLAGLDEPSEEPSEG